jgi:hypothetical protein
VPEIAPCRSSEKSGGAAAAARADAGGDWRKRDLERCPICRGSEGAERDSFRFVGQYLDEACSAPVAHRDFVACSKVLVSGKVKVSLQSRLRDKNNMEIEAEVGRHLAPHETLALYESKDGKCVRAAPVKGFKLTPQTCTNGQPVCSNAAGELSCGNCRTLPNGCSDYEGSRTYVALTRLYWP